MINKNYSLSISHLVLITVILLTLAFQPQSSIKAAANLSIKPITWNVIGLDSNNVNTGPNNFPVGIRVCNSGPDPATNVTTTFNWTTTNSFVDIRPGSMNPISLASLASGSCYDFYFEVQITRNASAYLTTRQYRIDVTADGGISLSTPTPREIFVEKLVSQNRNEVTDIKLNGVSIPAGGTMNLLVGNVYTIQMVGKTATNGYEQIESFINFPNTIFQVESVTASYSAFPSPHTDPDWNTKLYADGCGWVNDPGSANYRKCSGTGKYGGNITLTYTVKIIGGGGTSQTLNTLIYDFSGSSYHYNSDFSTSARTASIVDPSSCTQVPITQWEFTGDVTTPTSGTGTLTINNINVVTPTPFVSEGPIPPAYGLTNWTTSYDANRYLDFSVSTVGFFNIQFSFGANRAGNNAPTTARVRYSTDGSSFTATSSDFNLGTGNSTSWNSFSPINLSSDGSLNNNPNARFRIHAFGDGGSQNNRAVNFDSITITGCALPASLSLAKSADSTTFSSVGQVITYTYTLTNTGQVPLKALYAVTDDKITPVDCSGATSPLAPDASTTCTGSYTITSTDITAGLVTNTASATALNSATNATVTSNEASRTVYGPMTIGKAFSPDLIQVNGTSTLTITLNNPHSFDLLETSFTDIYPANVVNAATPNEATTCPDGIVTAGAGSDSISLSNATVPANSSCTVSVTVTASTSGVHTNSIAAGSVTTTQGITNAAEASDSLIVVGPPSISKSFSPNPITVGGTSTLTFTITNPNTSTVLTGVSFTDNLPAGMQVAAVPNASTSGCGLPTFAPAAGSSSFSFTGGIIPAGGVCTASVDVTGTSFGIKINTSGNVNSTNGGTGNTATASLTVNFGDFTVSKNADVPSVTAAGDVIQYTIVVTNTGTLTLTGISVNDPLLADLDCDPVTAGYQTSGLTLGAGDHMDCLGSYTVSQQDIDNYGGGDGDIDNTVTVDTNESSSLSASASVEIISQPEIDVTKTISNVVFINPQIFQVTYTISVENTGNQTLNNIQVADDLSAAFASAVSFEVLNINSTQFTVNNAFNGATNFQLLQGSDSLAPGGSGTITLEVKVDTGGEAQTYTNTVVAVGFTSDLSEISDQDSFSGPSFVDPAVLKSASVSQAQVGEIVTFTITVNNHGNQTATNVQVVDPISSKLDIVNVTATRGQITINGQTVTVDLGDLLAGEEIIITIVTRVNASGQSYVGNTVTLTTDSQTDIVSNNTASAGVNIVTLANVSLPLTGFKLGMVTALPPQPASMRYSNSQALTLEIPALGTSMPIVGIPRSSNSWDVTWLGSQAGWLHGTAFPTWNGNSVVTGHTVLSNGMQGPFSNIRSLRWGDRVVVRAFGSRYVYEVREVSYVQPNDASIFNHEELPWLTLLTCYRYNEEKDTYDYRVAVRAILVSITADTTQPSFKGWGAR